MEGHRAYLSKEIYHDSESIRAARTFDDLHEDEMPDTFRAGRQRSPFEGTDETMLFVRVETLSFIGAVTGEPATEIQSIFQGALGGDPKAVGSANVILQTLAEKSQHRPVFAAFLMDVEDLLKTPAPGWENTLRDRMGLLHHNPIVAADALPIVVLRYPARLVHAYKSGRRPIVPPTVLDGAINQAFCPSPVGTETGFTVDVGASSTSVDRRREVLHPHVTWKSEHLYRLGTITNPVNAGNLPLVRGFHLVDIQNHCSRPDYGMETDADLLR